MFLYGGSDALRDGKTRTFMQWSDDFYLRDVTF